MATSCGHKLAAVGRKDERTLACDRLARAATRAARRVCSVSGRRARRESQSRRPAAGRRPPAAGCRMSDVGTHAGRVMAPPDACSRSARIRRQTLDRGQASALKAKLESRMAF